MRSLVALRSVSYGAHEKAHAATPASTVGTQGRLVEECYAFDIACIHRIVVYLRRPAIPKRRLTAAARLLSPALCPCSLAQCGFCVSVAPCRVPYIRASRMACQSRHS